MRRWYSVAGINLNSSGNWVTSVRLIDVVCDETIFISSSNPSRQAIAYARRGSVFANFMSDGRNRDRAASMSYLSARNRTSDRRVKSSITGGGQG